MFCVIILKLDRLRLNNCKYYCAGVIYLMSLVTCSPYLAFSVSTMFDLSVSYLVSPTPMKKGHSYTYNPDLMEARGDMEKQIEANRGSRTSCCACGEKDIAR